MVFDATQPAYVAFRDIVAERTRPIMAWVGSGLSAEAGLPTWNQLKRRLASEARQKALTFEDPHKQRALRRIESAARQQNNWVAFGMLKSALGDASYRSAVRDALTVPSDGVLPPLYGQLWRLRLKGVINLNLDRIVTRAFVETDGGMPPPEFHGANLGAAFRLIGGPRQLIVNLHGMVDESPTWILTHDDLQRLFKSEAYHGFVASCLASMSVLFVGISADDVAVGGHFDNLTRKGIELEGHFWLTARQDPATDRWAESVGLRIIRYQRHGEDHSEAHEFFTDLVSFVPEELDGRQRPVVLDRAVAPEREIPPPHEIAAWSDPESIRTVLNDRARGLLASEDEAAYDAYQEFTTEYDEAIYRAWYTSTVPPRNALLGYMLEEEIATGAFGRVYRATDESGNTVAVKVLLQEIRQSHELLKSFRRGVRSMQILRRHQVDGMVAYAEASEIPAFVVMEWIEGPDLLAAKGQWLIQDWPNVLKVACGLARVIRTAHSLPERVLHRDIRPSNVMLKNYYVDPYAWQVVVLDFDLSWHKGAQEKSVLHTTSAGYLAPEQLRRVDGASTRSGAVDSFGLGMTLYFLCSGVEPVTNQHLHSDWLDTVRNASGGLATSQWRSLPKRFARIIEYATKDQQSERWDIAEISGELERLESAELNSAEVASAELWAEEFVSRSEVMRDYRWDYDAARAVRELPHGLRVSLSADEAHSKVRAIVEWAGIGVEDRSSISKYIGHAVDQAEAVLRRSGWDVESAGAESMSLRISAAVAVRHVAQRCDEMASLFDRAVRHLEF